jgi:hypothetical protein
MFSFGMVSSAGVIDHSIKYDILSENANKEIYLGYAKIAGNGSNSILEAVAENDLFVGIENKTGYVDFYIDYNMSCSGDTDNGQILLTVVINGQNVTPVLASTFDVEAGTLKVENVEVNRRDSFSFVITVIYASVIPFHTNQTQAVGAGVVSKSYKNIFYSSSPYYQFLDNLVKCFPLFEKILKQLLN